MSKEPLGDFAERLQRILGDRYEITEELGGAGMSRVFVAREIALGRDVVVKVLPPELGAGVNFDRFRREIQLAARLQHPLIVPLLFEGSKDDLLFYVMPRIEGETLRSRMSRSGELPIGETIRILRDVADALEYAHSHEVVHRDIKPENILVSGNHALVVDFGVAKALSAATGRSALTSIGVTLGTPTYMSPEQATADPAIDQRSDIYALGVVGYEMLTGMTPIRGVTAQQVIAAKVKDKPVSVSHFRPNVPPALNAIIMRCLERRPADRFQTAGELREQLEAVTIPGGGSGETRPTPTETAHTTRKSILAFASVAALLLVGSLLAGRYLGADRAAFEIGATSQITNDPGIEITPALSPDGKMLAYAAGEPRNTSVFVRQVNGGDAIRLASGRAPQWSPDGSKLVYVDSGGIATVPAFGGTPQRLVRSPENESTVGPVWSHDGKSLAYAQVRTNGGMGAVWVANADGSQPRKILDAKEPHSLSWSPNDDRLALVVGNILFVYSSVQFGNIAPSGLVVVGSDGKDPTALTDSIHHSVSPIWTPGGDGILYVSNIRGGNDLYYQRVRGNRPDGESQRLTTGLKLHGIAAGGNDRIAYSAWNTSVGMWSVPFPKSGSVSVQSARQVTSSNETIEVAKVSPDGQWLAFDSDRSGNMDIYKMRVDGTGLQQLTRNTADDFRPSWSPDGREIAFHSWRSGNRDLYVMSSDGSAERTIASGPAHEWAGTWSPDGSQLAFESDRSGQIEIYLVPAHGGTARRLTSDGGSGPRWSPDGKFIAYTVAVDNKPGTMPITPLRVIPSAGGESRTIVPPASLGRVVTVQSWSSDGQGLYIRVIAPNGNPNIARVSLDGRSGAVLVRFDDPTRQPFRPFFATDERNIYFTLGRHEADIWVMDLKKK